MREDMYEDIIEAYFEFLTLNCYTDNETERWNEYIATGVEDPLNKYRKDTFYHYLFELKFIPRNEYDASRADAGTDLRWQFMSSYKLEENIDKDILALALQRLGNCSMLEMMVALAIQVEDVMSDPNYPDRTSYWISRMVRSLGIGGWYEKTCDAIPDWREQVKTHIDRFNDGDYDANGEGGLWVLYHEPTDMRTLNIWDQTLLMMKHMQGKR